jgi:hypothetical protein
LKDVPELYELTARIQHLLRDAMNTIYTGGLLYCGELRKAFQEYDRLNGSIEAINWLTEPQSPVDVMMQLMRIFMVPEVTKFEVQNIEMDPNDFTDRRVYESRIVTQSHLVDIHQDLIANFDQQRGLFTDKRDPIPLRELINLREVKFRDEAPYAIVRRLLSTPLLHIHLHRIAGQNVTLPVRSKRSSKVIPVRIPETKITTTILPDETIILGDRSQLQLVSIVVHWGNARGGHYVAYIKCDNIWYLYNDVGFTHLIKIGSFNALFERRSGEPPVLQNATDFIYV